MRAREIPWWPGILSCWVVLLIGALLWPLIFPGMLFHRDMVVLDHPALSPSALGFGDLPARNAPQDGLLALVGLVFPASWFARALLVVSAGLGAWGAIEIARSLRAPRVAILLAVTITVLNPFILERLLQGHWSLCIAAWLLPGLAHWARTGRTRLACLSLWLCSLTPTGAVVAVVIALVSAPRWRTAIFGLACMLPWLVPSVLNPPPLSGDGAALFATRAESHAGVLGTVLSLGGLWNAAALPASRSHGAAWCGVTLFILLITHFRHIPRRLLVLAGVGLGLSLLSGIAPQLGAQVMQAIPGAAIFRDSHKLALLALPAFTYLAAALQPQKLAAVALCLALLGVWDAPMAVAKLRPVPEPAAVAELRSDWRGGEVFAPGLTTLVLHDGAATVNPLPKAIPMVESGELRVDGHQVDAPSARFDAASRLWHVRDLAGLRELGIAAVYEDGVMHYLTDSPHNGVHPLGFGLLLLWISLGVVTALPPAPTRAGNCVPSAPKKTPES